MPRVPTYTLPPGPRVIIRAPGMPLAQISTLNPGGTLIWLTGISEAGVTVSLGGWGARAVCCVGSARPCFHAGAPAGRFGLAAAVVSTLAGAADCSVVCTQPAAAKHRASRM